MSRKEGAMSTLELAKASGLRKSIQSHLPETERNSIVRNLIASNAVRQEWSGSLAASLQKTRLFTIDSIRFQLCLQPRQHSMVSKTRLRLLEDSYRLRVIGMSAANTLRGRLHNPI